MRSKTAQLVADRDILLNLERRRVIIAEWSPPLVPRYFYNIIPEISITQCGACYRVS